MDPNFYPEIGTSSVLSVRAALSQMRRHKGWLDRSDCPYDGATRAGLTELSKGLPVLSTPIEEVSAEDDEDRWITLERDTRQMLRDLQAFAKTITEADAKERMQMFRTGTALMEKLVGLAERSMNLRQVSDFQRRVISVFEQVLDPQQRTTAMTMLEAGA